MTRFTDEILEHLGIDLPSEVSRRKFLKIFGGGIVVTVSANDLLALQEAPARRRFGRALPDDFNAFLRVGEDGRVTCFTGKIEMGQGVVTSLAQMLADELEVSLDSVDMVMGDTDLCPWDMGTFGSMSTRFFGPPLRAAAAEAREVLLEQAAERLDVPVDQLMVSDGVVSITADPEKKISYAEIAKGQKIARRLDRKAVLESVENFTIAGRPVNRTDAVAKVTGDAKFSGDIRRKGMLYASLLRPPAHGATLGEVDASGIEAVAGAAMVVDGDLVAVLHETPDGAQRAIEKVVAAWETPELDLDEDTIFEHLLKVAPAGEALERGGDLDVGMSVSNVEARHTYLDGYVAHAPLETHTAVAEIVDGRCTIWASTQTPFRLQTEAAEALGWPEDKVRVVPPFVGGGFGGKSANRQAIEAARLAKRTGRPVQVAWSRAEEFFYDTFRPAAVVKIDAGVGEGGRITYWDYKTYFAGSRGADHFYDIPHHRTVAAPGGWRGGPGTHPFATGAWRAPGNNTNTFARESHIDILAVQAGIDPVEFRLRNLADKKMRQVLETTANRFGWLEAGAPSGRGQGLALGIDAGTYVGLAVEVDVDQPTGKVTVKRMVCAQNMGLAINPEGATIQMEGCLTMGLGYALAEQVRFSGGEILDTNFDTYEIPRFSWLPEIETFIIDAEDDPPQGGGEPAIVVVGAAIANAIYDAVGARVYRMPMTAERVLFAMERSQRA
ncbi:MAG: xanthine dehydrogenase family protein molybdopterin-binding subunit [Acidobacteria bacterium]|nr:xanthine dehydrogenase family protein molybdopterin-binding subunit [Candidatus Sulfomarinibacter kjeldsenii]